jgi:accessory gene regulator protein AgrB
MSLQYRFLTDTVLCIILSIVLVILHWALSQYIPASFIVELLKTVIAACCVGLMVLPFALNTLRVRKLNEDLELKQGAQEYE